MERNSKTAPWDVKKSIGKVAQQFSGFAQQDSYELFNYLVDTLHEDLNRVIEKPYVETPDSEYRPDEVVSKEHWDAFTARNRSVIVDLMYGQLKSALKCKECGYESNTFDPFLALSVPIPKPTKSKCSVHFYPINLEGKGVQELSVPMTKSETIADLKEKLFEHLKIDKEVYNFYIM